MSDVVLPWCEVEPLPELNGDVARALTAVDNLHSAWKASLTSVAPQELKESRDRSLRRHAIETGIIEQLYDVSWGVTEALVAEGITVEVASREGGVTDDALAAIRAQLGALEFLADCAREGRPLSVHLVRQLHQAITSHQAAYDGRNQFGQIVRAPLHHGEWKTQPNHVRRQDGSILQYTPPERVQDQMDELIAQFAQTSGSHPVARAAWLHHRFICIHPFEDGNGRVARALSLLVLLRAEYAPLVVDRHTREGYIEALDLANAGDLAPLIRLFAKLEELALRSELERPATATVEGQGAVQVARAYVQRLRTIRDATSDERRRQAEELASLLLVRVEAMVKRLGDELRDTFRELDSAARASEDHAEPPDPRARFWYSQIVRSAKEADFFANLSDGTWWSRLHVTALEVTLRYVVVIQKVGHGETGVLAVTMFAETFPSAKASEDDRPEMAPALRLTSQDSVTLVYGDDPDVRWPEVSAAIERTLAAAVANFSRAFG